MSAEAFGQSLSEANKEIFKMEHAYIDPPDTALYQGLPEGG